MNKYQYQARDPNGNVVGGVIESTNEISAAKTLHDHDLLIVTLKQKREIDFKSLSLNKSTVSERDLANFTRLLATMLATGLPLTDALSNLASQNSSKYFKEIILTILRDIQGGSSLSESMSRYPNIFNNLYINLTKAGEASGKMAESFERLADTMEKSMEFKGKIRGAMIYPTIIVITMIGVATIMITFVVPQIAEVYKQFNAELPLPTQILIGVSDIIHNYTLVVIALVVMIYVGYRLVRQNPAGELLFNNLVFKLPVVGKMNIDTTISLMCRVLSTLLATGVAIMEALNIVAHTMENNYFRQALEQAAKEVEKGLPLSLAFKRNPDMPVMLSQLIAIGEDTGTVDQSLMRLANFFQDSAERTVKTLTSALEPLMLIIMGIMVGGLALAILLPMFNLVNVIK